MSTRDKRSAIPRPGRVTAFLMARRLTERERGRLFSELGELYEHRVRTQGERTARAWLRREYRRWGMALVSGRADASAGAHVADAVARSGRGAPGLLRDLRHNLRGLRRAPLFSAAIVLTVGVGIGGTTLVYTVVHSVLVAPLPYPDSDRMVLLRTRRGEDQWGTSMADLVAVYDPPPAFEGIAGYRRRTASVGYDGAVELLRAKWVTDSYFPLLGIEPIRGRGFTEAEGGPGGANVTLVTEAFRDRVFGSDRSALGRSLLINGEPHTVVGILPSRMGPLDREEVYPALRVEMPSRKGPFFFPTLGRLREGVDPAQARQQLDAIAQRNFPIWQQSFPFEDATLSFVDLKEILVGDVARTLLVVLTAVGFLLLIASANAASLLVARGMAKEREVAIRSALGASSGRLFQLLLSEAGLLAAGGAIVGLALAWFGVDVVRGMALGQLPRIDEVAVTPEVIAFFAAVTTGSWALFGIVAAGAVLRRRTEGLASAAVRATASRGARRLRRGLVATQIAVSVPMLVAAGLLTVSLDRLESEDYGFDPQNLVSVLISLPTAGYPDEQSVRGFWDDVLPSIEALPGVLEAGLADARPPVAYPESNNFKLADDPGGPDAPQPQAPWITASPGYFETLGVRLLEGNIYNDLSDTMRTAVVDQAWAERYYPGRPAVGMRFRSGGCTVEGCPWVEVAGVVSNVKTTGLDDPKRGTVYYDFRRSSYSQINLHLRTRGAPLDAIPDVRRLIRERDASIPLTDVITAEEVANQSLVGRRYTSLLVTLVAATALLLSLVGIYGAMSYFVRQHTRDIGIRIALGGGPEAALRMVVVQGLKVAALGTAVGVTLALALTRYMDAMLYEVATADPLVFGAVVVGTLTVTLAATVIPGRQAASTEPAAALRED
jgi:putative ABC transport system permease protein